MKIAESSEIKYINLGSLRISTAFIFFPLEPLEFLWNLLVLFSLTIMQWSKFWWERFGVWKGARVCLMLIESKYELPVTLQPCQYLVICSLILTWFQVTIDTEFFYPHIFTYMASLQSMLSQKSVKEVRQSSFHDKIQLLDARPKDIRQKLDIRKLACGRDLEIGYRHSQLLTFCRVGSVRQFCGLHVH